MEKLFSQGAEGEIYATTYDGRPALKKVRHEKKYRHPALDANIRKRRSRREAKVLRAARAGGVKCPELFFEDEMKFSLTMERIGGKLLSRSSGISKKDAQAAGVELAKLHSQGIAHGDYSASNILATPQGICMIDFGLAEFTNSVEELACDVLLFEKSLQTAGNESGASGLKGAFEKGYSQNFKDAKPVFTRVGKILERARYKPKA